MHTPVFAKNAGKNAKTSNLVAKFMQQQREKTANVKDCACFIYVHTGKFVKQAQTQAQENGNFFISLRLRLRLLYVGSHVLALALNQALDPQTEEELNPSGFAGSNSKTTIHKTLWRLRIFGDGKRKERTTEFRKL